MAKFLASIIVLINLMSKEAINGELTVRPENVAVVEGTPIVMKCSTNGSQFLRWLASPDQRNKEDVRVYVNKKIHPMFNESVSIDIRRGEGQFNLKINSTLSNARRYICRDPGFNDSSAELVVLQSDPACGVNQTADDGGVVENGTDVVVRLWCEVRFRGNWIPTVEWKTQDTSRTIITDVTPDVTTTDNVTIIRSVLTLPVELDTFTGSEGYSCVTRFTQNNRPNSTTAVNTPNYSFKCQPRYGSSVDLFISVMVLLIVVLVSLIFLVIAILFRKHVRPSKRAVRRETDIPPIELDAPPAYTLVNKTSKAPFLDRVPSPNGCTSIQVPIYSQVNKRANVQGAPLMENTRFSPAVIVGTDGTEYVQMNAVRHPEPSFQMSYPSFPNKDKFETSTYAQIDHTIRPPTPKLGQLRWI